GPPLGAEVVGEEVELGLVGGGEIAAPGPPEGRRERQRGTDDPGELRGRQVGALDGVALRARRYDQPAGHDELPGRALRGSGLRLRAATRGGEQAGRAEQAEREAGGPAPGAGRGAGGGGYGEGAGHGGGSGRI